jgi:hypothetical protein
MVVDQDIHLAHSFEHQTLLVDQKNSVDLDNEVVIVAVDNRQQLMVVVVVDNHHQLMVVVVVVDNRQQLMVAVVGADNQQTMVVVVDYLEEMTMEEH